MKYRKVFVSLLILASLCTSLMTGNFAYQIPQKQENTVEETRTSTKSQQQPTKAKTPHGTQKEHEGDQAHPVLNRKRDHHTTTVEQTPIVTNTQQDMMEAQMGRGAEKQGDHPKGKKRDNSKIKPCFEKTVAIESHSHYYVFYSDISVGRRIGWRFEVEDGPAIDFWITDEEGYTNYTNGGSFYYYVESEGVKSYEGVFTTPKDGTFYFIFDNTFSYGGGGWSSVTLHILSDANPPDVSIYSPGFGNTIEDDRVSIKWSGSDEESTIDHYEVQVDGGFWKDVGDSTSYETESLSDGDHTVKVKAVDYFGHTNVDSVSFTVDTKPPTISITSPESGVTAEVSDVPVEWTGSDGGSGINHYEVRIDGGSWKSAGMNTSYTFTGLNDGDHTFTVKAVDKVGQETTESRSFTVNTSPIGGPGMTEEIATGVGVGITVAAIAVALYFLKVRKS